MRPEGHTIQQHVHKHKRTNFQWSLSMSICSYWKSYQLYVPALTTGAVSGTIPLLVVAGYILASFPSSRPQEWVYPLRGGKCNLFLLWQLHTFHLLQDFQQLKERIVKHNQMLILYYFFLERTNSTILLW